MIELRVVGSFLVPSAGLSQRHPPQEVNQSLVDDGLVDLDKIGASNFFWSFPSKVAVTKQNIVDSLKQNITKVTTDVAVAERQVSTYIMTNFAASSVNGSSNMGLAAVNVSSLVLLVARKEHTLYFYKKAKNRNILTAGVGVQCKTHAGS